MQCNMKGGALHESCHTGGAEHYEFVMHGGGRFVVQYIYAADCRRHNTETLSHMTTKIREGSVLAVVMDEAHRQLVFNVRGAAPDGGNKSITLDLSAVHEANIAYAALHGFKQRIGDMAALSRNPDTGKPATPAEKFEALARGVEHYMSGSADWNLRAAAGERTSGELGLLSRAVAEATGKDVITARDWLKTKSRAEQVSIALSDRIKPIMDRMRSEVAAPVDAEDLLAELG